MAYSSKEKRNEHQREALKKMKAELVSLLGDKCDKCGSTENLTIEHKNGRDYQVRRLSSWQRLKRYKDELASGVSLGLLCLSCNSAGGDYWSRFYAEKRADEVHVPMLPEEPFDEDSRV